MAAAVISAPRQRCLVCEGTGVVRLVVRPGARVWVRACPNGCPIIPEGDAA